MTFIAPLAALALAVQDPPAPPPPHPPLAPRVMMFSHADPGGLDENGDGFISRDEFAAPMTDHFARLDKDGDGRLSKDEMHGGMGEHDVMIRRGAPMAWTGAPGEDGRHVFVVTGGDGEGETHTWTSEDGREVRVETRVVRGGPGMAPMPPHPPMPPHAPGAPHPEGASVFVHRVGGPDGGAVFTGPGEMDRDGDGRVTEAEFLAPMREAFARMDADGSGALEEGERGNQQIRVIRRESTAPAAD
jgi:hypothetical protein